jgi:hypothetical protein
MPKDGANFTKKEIPFRKEKCVCEVRDLCVMNTFFQRARAPGQGGKSKGTPIYVRDCVRV